MTHVSERRRSIEMTIVSIVEKWRLRSYRRASRSKIRKSAIRISCITGRKGILKGFELEMRRKRISGFG